MPSVLEAPVKNTIAPVTPSPEMVEESLISLSPKPRLWMPKRVVFTPAALALPWGQQIRARVEALGLPVEELPANRLTGLRGSDARETYRAAKSTLAVVTAPASQFRLQPIPPSADWQFHLAEGCPAHCQYCYLAGSLSGPPVVRVYANLPEILHNLANYETPPGTAPATYEASCYTDPGGIEHLTGSLAETIRYFGTRQQAHLRWVSKFDNVDGLLDLPHNGHTRCRASVNAAPVSRQFEGGVSPVSARLRALRKLALPREQGGGTSQTEGLTTPHAERDGRTGGGYPVGIVVAPIMPIDDWEAHYTALLDDIARALDFDCDLTFELITHRFTPGSRDVLSEWYPATKLDMTMDGRDTKRNKFGGVKYVYQKDVMKRLRAFFETEIAARFPQAKVLYFT